MPGVPVHKSNPSNKSKFWRMAKNAGYSPMTTVDIDEVQSSSPAYSDLEGEIASSALGGKPSHDRDFDTLDEPVWQTVKRDLAAVGQKFGHVLFPKRSSTLLRDWDLWGPLFLCVFLSLLLQGGDNDGKSPQFTQIFTITFFGSCIVTMNSKLLGGTISFFQSLCVLGYCLLPTASAALICKLIVFSVSDQGTFLFLLRLVLTVLGFSWATFASTAFLAGSQPPNRKALAVYPIFLFYFIVSWLTISHTHYGHD